MEDLAERLAAVPGVVAVTLGGSRAIGAAVEGSDWDFGLYYRGGLDPADISALGWPGRVFAPGEWGSIVNGGAWLTIGGQRVDFLYRNLEHLERVIAEAEAGRYELHYLQQPPFGFFSGPLVPRRGCDCPPGGARWCHERARSRP